MCFAEIRIQPCLSASSIEQYVQTMLIFNPRFKRHLGIVLKNYINDRLKIAFTYLNKVDKNNKKYPVELLAIDKIFAIISTFTIIQLNLNVYISIRVLSNSHIVSNIKCQ